MYLSSFSDILSWLFWTMVSNDVKLFWFINRPFTEKQTTQDYNDKTKIWPKKPQKTDKTTDFYKNKPKRAVWEEEMFPMGPMETFPLYVTEASESATVINKHNFLTGKPYHLFIINDKRIYSNSADSEQECASQNLSGTHTHTHE